MIFPHHPQRTPPSRLLATVSLAALVVCAWTAWEYISTRHTNPTSAQGTVTVQEASDGSPAAHPHAELAFAPAARTDRSRDKPSDTHVSAAAEALPTASANAGSPAPPRQERAEPRALSEVLESWAHAAANPEFTQEMKSYLEETARAVKLDPRLVDSAECRGNICRVKLVFTTPESALAFQDAANPSADYTVYLAGAAQMDGAVRPGTSPGLDITIERALPPTAANDRPEREP